VTCLPTGKRYVGFTSRCFKERWARHKLDAKKGSGYLLHRAIRKHGEANFTVRLLLECTESDLALKMEKLCISELDSLAPSGLNLASGGQRPEWHPSSRAKIGARTKANWRKTSYRNKILAARATPEDRGRARAANLAAQGNPELRKRIAEKLKALSATPEVRERLSKQATMAWASAVYKTRQAEGLRKHYADPAIRLAASIRAKQACTSTLRQKLSESHGVSAATREAIVAQLADGAKPQVVAKALDISPGVVLRWGREYGVYPPAKPRRNLRPSIETLLSEGLKQAEVCRKLSVAPGYVSRVAAAMRGAP
jgi:group I intron endonuclease